MTCEVKFGLKFALRHKFGLRLQFQPLDLAEVDLTQCVRVYRFENAMQRHCSGACCLPYIDTRLDCELPSPRDSSLFSPEHYGNNWGAVRTGFAANWDPEPRDCNIFGNRAITRWTDRDSCRRGVVYTEAMMTFSLSRSKSKI